MVEEREENEGTTQKMNKNKNVREVIVIDEQDSATFEFSLSPPKEILKPPYGKLSTENNAYLKRFQA